MDRRPRLGCRGEGDEVVAFFTCEDVGEEEGEERAVSGG